MLYRASKLIFN